MRTQMRAKLSTQTSQFGTIAVAFTRECLIGEDESCMLILGSAGLSGKHARVFFDGIQQAFFVEDLDSANGTKVNGRRVSGKERLSSGEIITFGDTIDFVFQLHSDEPAGAAESAPRTVLESGLEQIPAFIVHSPPETARNETIEVPPSHLADTQRVYFLDILTYPFKRTFKLENGTTLIGRSPECAVELQDMSVSQHHAVITVGEGRVTIQDLDSKNRTFLNSTELSEMVELTSGDKISFGRVEAKFLSSSVPSPKKVL